MGELVTTDADKDIEAKDAVWWAIQLLSGELLSKWQVETYFAGKAGGLINRSTPRPTNQPLWKLVEILSVFVVLKDADHVRAMPIFHLLGAIPTPVEFTKGGEQSYLWTQRRMGGSVSGFGGIPDIVITTDAEPPSRSNIVDIIEIKSGKIDSRLIRQEFAKGYDLKVNSYTILSYQLPKDEQIEGARQLGIELEHLGFDSQTAVRRERLQPQELITWFSQVLTERRGRGWFGIKLGQTAGVAQDKRLRRLPRSTD